MGRNANAELHMTARERYEAKALLEGGFARVSVAVIGDFMLDRYLIGDAERISPEAPVPVVRFRKERITAGGAGNVAANLVGLGLSVSAAGGVGDDMYGRALLGLSLFRHVDTTALIPVGATTVKTRVVASAGSGSSQLVRIDVEEKLEPTQEQRVRLLEGVKSAVTRGAGLIIISDYGKGCCSHEMCREVISYAKSEHIPVWVDPKKADWESYRDADLVTPNVKELSLAAGRRVANDDADVTRAATALMKKFSIARILVTRSEKGATLVDECSARHFPVPPSEVSDVSGAGDTMIATAAAFYAGGMSLPCAVKLANAAAQIVIGKVGTYAVRASELLVKINAHRAISTKVIDAESAESLCARWRKAGLRVVFTNGCFDIIHAGHIDSLTQSKALGDRLIVGLNSDDSVRRLKGDSRPVNGEAARAKVLAALEAVDAVVIFCEDTPAELLSRLRPDILVKGGDYKPEEVAGSEYAGRVVILPLTAGFSTTSIIEKARER